MTIGDRNSTKKTDPVVIPWFPANNDHQLVDISVVVSEV